MSKESKTQSHYIFGRHAAKEAVAAGVPIEKAYLSEKYAQQLIPALNERDIPFEIVSNRKLESFAKNASHQGVLLEVAPYAYAPLQQILDATKGEDNALILVLDHIEDEGNLGAIARTAEVVGASGLIIPNARAAGIGAGAYKASAGAVAYLPIAQVPNLVQTLDALKKEGFWIVGATEHAQDTLWEAPLNGRIALVMGSEKQGIAPLVLKHCDFLAKLPQVGSIESLNVAQAATVFAYEWMRQSKIKEFR